VSPLSLHLSYNGPLTLDGSTTWRSPFYLLAGFTLLCFLGGLISIDNDVHSEEVDKRIDWLGALLVTAGLVLIVFVLSQGELARQGWSTPCKRSSTYKRF